MPKPKTPAKPTPDAELVEADPERFFRPPYVGANGWVGVVLDTGPDWDVVAELVRDAFLVVAGKRLRERLLAKLS